MDPTGRWFKTPHRFENLREICTSLANPPLFFRDRTRGVLSRLNRDLPVVARQVASDRARHGCWLEACHLCGL